MCHGLHQGAVEAIEEGLQETISTYGSNAIARQLYDEDRFLGEGALQAGQVGGTAGFIAGFALSALGVKGAAGMGRAPANWVIDEPLDKEGKHPSDPFVRLGFRHDGPRPRDDDPDDKELTEVWIHRVTTMPTTAKSSRTVLRFISNWTIRRRSRRLLSRARRKTSTNGEGQG